MVFSLNQENNEAHPHVIRPSNALDSIVAHTSYPQIIFSIPPPYQASQPYDQGFFVP